METPVAFVTPPALPGPTMNLLPPFMAWITALRGPIEWIRRRSRKSRSAMTMLSCFPTPYRPATLARVSPLDAVPSSRGLGTGKRVFGSGVQRGTLRAIGGIWRSSVACWAATGGVAPAVTSCAVELSGFCRCVANITRQVASPNFQSSRSTKITTSGRLVANRNSAHSCVLLVRNSFVCFSLLLLFHACPRFSFFLLFSSPFLFPSI